MKLHLAGTTTQNTFTGYGDGYVMLNGRRIISNVLVMPEFLIEPWAATDFTALDKEHFIELFAQKPAMLLLGTGGTFRFPHPSINHALTSAGIGLEVMDTPAACRTYNILLAEGRRVAAALFVAL